MENTGEMGYKLLQFTFIKISLMQKKVLYIVAHNAIQISGNS